MTALCSCKEGTKQIQKVPGSYIYIGIFLNTLNVYSGLRGFGFEN